MYFTNENNLYMREPCVGSALCYITPPIYDRAIELLGDDYNCNYYDTIRKCLYVVETEHTKHKLYTDLVGYYETILKG